MLCPVTFFQILHTGSDDWVCISSLGCMPGMVNVYDSLYNDVISQEIEEQVNDFLGARLISLDYVPVQHQINGSDCRVFLLLSLHVLLLLLIPAMLLLMFQRCVHTYKIVYNVAK